MQTAFITHPDCLQYDLDLAHPESRERLDAIADLLLMKGLLDCMDSYQAPLASREALCRAHQPAYVDRLEELARRGAQLDPDTRIDERIHRAALRAAGAAVLAADLVIQGRATSAFCSVRPPGHHAGRASASGFCLFNNVAVGIRHALEVHGLQRIALIDFDAHHGDGSEDIFHDDGRVLMCSIFEEGLFPYSGSVPRGANMVNVPLPRGAGGDALRAVVEQRWLPALHAFAPEMIFISAGFDGHLEDDMSSLRLVEADYAWITVQAAAIAQAYGAGRIVSCLEGGYAYSALARGVAAHVKVLASPE